MSDLCLNEGTLQSYCDGQLAPEVLEQARAHLASCSLCTEAAREVESEMDIATNAFAAEMTLSVPSERLRTRIEAALAGLEIQPTVTNQTAWSRMFAWLGAFGSSLNLSPQRAFGFASILIFFVLATIIGGIVMKQRGSGPGSNVIAGNQSIAKDVTVNKDPVAREADSTGELDNSSRVKRKTTMRSNRQRITPSSSDNQIRMAHLPGERNYLQAISVLTEAIDANGESSLKPTLLSDYKRNLEVVNEAIKATQRTARTNPESPDAAEMLFAVYQSKLDLLSAVAEQSRPMIAQR